MGDPVTMAVVGGTIGAATSDDPLKGALMGAAGGYAGGSLMGAGTGGGFAGGGFGSIGTAGQTAGGAGSMFGGMSGLFGQGGALSQAGQAASVYNQFNQAFNPQQPRMAGLGASVRPGGQISPVDYMSLLNPQQQTVLRPAPVSLL